MKRFHRLQIPAWADTVIGTIIFFSVFFALVATAGQIMSKYYKHQFAAWVPYFLVTGGETNHFKQSNAERSAQAIANQSILKMMEK